MMMYLFIREDIFPKGIIKIIKIPSLYQHMWISLRWRQCLSLQQPMINLAKLVSLARLYVSIVLNNYVQFCTVNPRAQGKPGNIFNHTSWKFLFPSLKVRSFRTGNCFILTPIPEVQAMHFFSLNPLPAAKQEPRIFIKWDRNVRRKSEPKKHFLLQGMRSQLNMYK